MMPKSEQRIIERRRSRKFKFSNEVTSYRVIIVYLEGEWLEFTFFFIGLGLGLGWDGFFLILYKLGLDIRH